MAKATGFGRGIEALNNGSNSNKQQQQSNNFGSAASVEEMLFDGNTEQQEVIGASFTEENIKLILEAGYRDGLQDIQEFYPIGYAQAIQNSLNDGTTSKATHRLIKPMFDGARAARSQARQNYMNQFRSGIVVGLLGGASQESIEQPQLQASVGTDSDSTEVTV